MINQVLVNEKVADGRAKKIALTTCSTFDGVQWVSYEYEAHATEAAGYGVFYYSLGLRHFTITFNPPPQMWKKIISIFKDIK